MGLKLGESKIQFCLYLKINFRLFFNLNINNKIQIKTTLIIDNTLDMISLNNFDSYECL